MYELITMSRTICDSDVITSPARQIAITIDDLPSGDTSLASLESLTEMTSKLLAVLQEQEVPATGFVNERKLFKRGEVDERIRLLAKWMEAGFELGNHTFSHASLNRVGLKEFEDEVIQGETITRWLLAEKRMTLRYFRHPYLETGRDSQTRRAAEVFLAQRGYGIAPVTVDVNDWVFSVVYADARRRGDRALQEQIVACYLTHVDAVLAHCEQLSRRLVVYEVRQILLLHATWLEAEHLAKVLQVMREREYKFITLDEALSDHAYRLPETYISEKGISWLERWAITLGLSPQSSPSLPALVLERSKALGFT
jgi:peptidoglycan/xylan/chitin deacetylase (PgdA/CDA1 family)